MTDKELAENIERCQDGSDYIAFTLRYTEWQQIIAALRRADLAQAEIKGHMRVEDELKAALAVSEEFGSREHSRLLEALNRNLEAQARIAELEKAIVGECEDCGQTILTPLHPLPSVEKDAARYRWLREFCGQAGSIQIKHDPKALDEFIDAAFKSRA